MSYYGPRFANIASGWYWETSEPNYAVERDATLLVWNEHCDDVLRKFLSAYGTFFTAFEKDIAAAVGEITGSNPAKLNRYFCYFIAARAWSLVDLRSAWETSNAHMEQLTFACGLCGVEVRFVDSHPNVVYRCAGTPRYCRECDYTARRYEKLGPKIMGKVRDFLKVRSRPQTCALCENEFSPVQSQYEFVQSAVDPIYLNLFVPVCSECFKKAFNDYRRGTKEARLARLKDLFDLTGRIPTMDYSTLFFSCSDRSSILKLLRILMKTRTAEGYAEDYGSFFAALVQAGVLPEGTRKMSRGTMVLARDGHLCLSIPEKEIDDCLHSMGIRHDKEVAYPGSAMRADWELFDLGPRRVFVEYFGMMSEAAYAQKARSKIELAQKAGIELIEIYPHSNFSQMLLQRVSGRPSN